MAVGAGEPGDLKAGGVNAATGGRKGAEATEGVVAGALGGRRPGVTKGAFGRGALKGALGPVVADVGREIEGTAGGREMDGGADTGKGGGAEGRETAMPGAGGAGGREAEALSVGEAEGGAALACASAAMRAADSLRSRTTSSADFTIGPAGPLA